jgi:hypothetical protein
MHVDQPTLSSWPLLNLRESDLLVDLIAQPNLFEAFRKLVAFLVARWDTRGCV